MLSSSFRDGRRAAEFAAIGFIKREVNMVGFCTVDFAKLRRELSYDDILLILFSLFSLILMHFRRLVVSSQIFRLLMGKTFLWNTIITTPRSDARIVLAIASLGVTPFLFPRGRTGHSCIRLPV